MLNQPCIYCGKPLDYWGERCPFCGWSVRHATIRHSPEQGFTCVVLGPNLGQMFWIDEGVLIVLSWEHV